MAFFVSGFVIKLKFIVAIFTLRYAHALKLLLIGEFFVSRIDL